MIKYSFSSTAPNTTDIEKEIVNLKKFYKICFTTSIIINIVGFLFILYQVFNYGSLTPIDGLITSVICFVAGFIFMGASAFISLEISTLDYITTTKDTDLFLVFLAMKDSDQNKSSEKTYYDSLVSQKRYPTSAEMRFLLRSKALKNVILSKTEKELKSIYQS